MQGTSVLFYRRTHCALKTWILGVRRERVSSDVCLYVFASCIIPSTIFCLTNSRVIASVSDEQEAYTNAS